MVTLTELSSYTNWERGAVNPTMYLSMCSYLEQKVEATPGSNQEEENTEKEDQSNALEQWVQSKICPERVLRK